MAVVLVFLFMLIGSASSFATETPQKVFVGCFNRLSDGALQFGAVPSGELFTIRGDTDLAEEHVNQLVRVFGDFDRTDHDNSAASLIILKVQVLASSCTSVTPSIVLDGVPGKVGEDTVAVPLTDTSTQGRTTPGFQTGAATGHPAGTRFSNRPNVEPPLAAPLPTQVGQSEAAANVNARSVGRTEILPGVTLGVTGSESKTAAVPSESATGASTQSGPAPTVVTIRGNREPILSPPKVSIQAGRTVLWVNSTATMQEIIANPARETQLSDATIPANVKPFDSGFLRPDQSFRYQFSAPGVYRYFCKVGTLNNSAQVLGEVDVQ